MNKLIAPAPKRANFRTEAGYDFCKKIKSAFESDDQDYLWRAYEFWHERDPRLSTGILGLLIIMREVQA